MLLWQQHVTAATTSPGKQCTGRQMHQTTICLGAQTPFLSTTHTQSVCGPEGDSQPRVFLRNPCYTSQHHCGLKITNVPKGVSSFSSTHSGDVHNLKAVTPHYVLRSLRNGNWTRNREGLAMKEVTNPPGDTVYRSSYRSDHCAAETIGQREPASGRPTHWHQHDIFTGENKTLAAFPIDPRRKRLESDIRSARCWERDCTALRLY